MNAGEEEQSEIKTGKLIEERVMLSAGFGYTVFMIWGMVSVLSGIDPAWPNLLYLGGMIPCFFIVVLPYCRRAQQQIRAARSASDVRA